MQKPNLIPIGKFSKRTRLSVKALRLYAEKGLLLPAYVDSDTGYRYYHSNQANQAELIKTLRLVEMPLEDISAILNSNNQEKVLTQLLAHKSRLSEKLAVQQRMLSHLESLIRNEETTMSYEISIEDLKAQQIATVKYHSSLANISDNIMKGLSALMNSMGNAQAQPAGAPMVIYHSVIDQDTEGDIEVAIPVAAPFSDDDAVTGRELEAGTMAVTVHKGPYEKLSAAYHSITDWIDNNGYDISGAPREIYLNDPQQVSQEEILTRLEFPVIKSAS